MGVAGWLELPLQRRNPLSSPLAPGCGYSRVLREGQPRVQGTHKGAQRPEGTLSGLNASWAELGSVPLDPGLALTPVAEPREQEGYQCPSELESLVEQLHSCSGSALSLSLSGADPLSPRRAGLPERLRNRVHGENRLLLARKCFCLSRRAATCLAMLSWQHSRASSRPSALRPRPQSQGAGCPQLPGSPQLPGCLGCSLYPQ